MLRQIAQRSLVVLALAVLAAPTPMLHAQSVVTGGNPQPTGEDPPSGNSGNVAVALILSRGTI